MSKEQFIEIMQELLSLQKDTEEVNKAFNKLDPEWQNSFYLGRHESLIVKTLKLAVNDINDWVEYYLYECRWGKNPLQVTVKDKTFKLKTLNQLWWLINN